jgi:hypothetical protein
MVSSKKRASESVERLDRLKAEFVKLLEVEETPAINSPVRVVSILPHAG